MIRREKLNTHLAIFLVSFAVIFSEFVLVKILSGIRIGFSLASFFVYAGAILGLGLGNFLWLSRKGRVPWLEKYSVHAPSFLIFLLLFIVILSLLLLQFLAFGRFFELIMASMYIIYPAIVFVYCLFGYLIAGILAKASRSNRTVLTWAFDVFGSAAGGILPVVLLAVLDPPMQFFIPVIAALAVVLTVYEFRTRKEIVKVVAPLVLLAVLYSAVIPGLRSYDLLRSAYPREYSSITERTIDNFRGFFTGGYRMDYIGWSPYRKLNYIEQDSLFSVTYDNIATTALMKWNEPFRPASLFTYPENCSNSLIIGAGCGGQIPLLRPFSDTVTAVELDPMVVGFAKSTAGPDHFLHAPDVNYLSSEGLSFLKSNPGPYSYILFPLTDTFITSAAQSLVKAENYLYTKEGIETSISSLTDDGVLIIALASAMNQYGSDTMNRSFPTVAVHLYRNLLDIGVPTENFAIASATEYMRGGVFLVYDNSGLDRDRFDSLMEGAEYADQVLTDDPEFIEFASGAEVTSNDRPFFYIAGTQPPPPLMVAALFLALSAIIPITFLFVKARKKGALKGVNKTFLKTEMLYAVATGFGFMGMGTLLIQRIIPVFGVPYLAGTVILSSLLTGGGIISYLLGTRNISWKGMGILSIIAVAVVLASSLFSADTFSGLASLTVVPRILVTFFLFLPVGLLLGGFFPKLLQVASSRGEAHVILAYGTDVTFSIVGIVVSLIVPIMFGYRVMFYLVGLAYLLVGLLVNRLRKLEAGQS